MTEINKNAIIVLGMHRSGTSAVTAGLQALGIELGDCKTYKTDENPKGYFENWDVVDLNERILQHLGGSWSNPFVRPNSWPLHELDQFFDEAVHILQNSYGRYPLWVLKDPRVSLLLPFWDEAIARTFSCEIWYVHVLRNPLEVAGSLKSRRDADKKFLCGDIPQSLLLWFSYHYNALASVSNDRNILVDFADLINDPTGQLKRLASFLDITPNLELVAEYSSSFLEKDLKHHTSSIAEVRKDYPDFFFVADLYDNLRTVGGTASFSRKKAQNIISELPDGTLFQTCCQVAAPLFQNAVNENSYEQQIATLKEREKHLSGELTKSEELGTTLYGTLSVRDEEINSLTNELSSRDGQIVSLTNDLSSRDGQIVSFTNDLSSRDVQITSLTNELSSRDEHIIALGRELRDKITDYHAALRRNNKLTGRRLWRMADLAGRVIENVPGASLVRKQVTAFQVNRHLAECMAAVATSGLFDKAYYLAHNPRVKEQGIDPLTHFLTEGVKNGIRPGPSFDPAYYLAMNPDVYVTGVDPLIHYIQSGREEGRLPQAVMPSPSESSLSEERYTSQQKVLFFCHDNSQERRINQFFELLQWFYRYTAIDIHVVLLGKWKNYQPEIFFPTLVLDPTENSPKELQKKIFSWSSTDLCGYYFNDCLGLESIAYLLNPRDAIICRFEKGLDNFDYLFEHKLLHDDNSVRFVVSSDLDASLLLESHNVEMDNVKIIDLSQLTPLVENDVSWDLKCVNEFYSYVRQVMDIQPVVSVIVPNYNHCDYLDERLTSIFSQTFRDMEILLLDDASTDDSVDLLDVYAKRYPLVSVKKIYNKINSGSVFQQWKKGVNSAVGELVWIAESDDYCKDSFLQKMLTQMVNPKVMLAYCQSYCMPCEKEVAMTYADIGYYDHLGRERWFNDYTVQGSEEICNYFAVYNIIPNVSSALIRNVGMDIALAEIGELALAGDWSFYIRHIEGAKISYLAQALSYHRVHGDSIIASNRNDNLLLEFSKMHEMIGGRYLLSTEIKKKMLLYAQYFVAPSSGGISNDTFHELYDVNALRRVEPGRGCSLFQDETFPVETDIKPIAFYLPQFHAIPENDEWWGEGFTEWTNTRRGKPLLSGHYQPRTPHGDTGYYDLSDWSVLAKQAKLAQEYGIHGFCFYHYWFDGERLLEKPVELLLKHPEITLPFCLCWANENWSRRWDGQEDDILMAQNHSPSDDLAFIKDMSRYLQDSRYILMDGKPLVIIYRPELLPNPVHSAMLWRKWCRENNIGEIYLAYVQGFTNPENPADIGFDAKVEFPPLISYDEDVLGHPQGLDDDFDGNILSYPSYVKQIMLKRETEKVSYPFFRTVMMAWDNTARRGKKATIFNDFSLQTYREWLLNTVAHTRQDRDENSRFFFINAWNEWAEGTYLEPDLRYGYSCLEAVRDSIVKGNRGIDSGAITGNCVVYVTHDAHMHGAQMLSLHIVRAMKENFGTKVYLIMLGGGALKEQFGQYATVLDFSSEGIPKAEQGALLNEIKEMGAKVAYCSTVVSGGLVELLATVGFRVITLVHELSSVIESYGLSEEASAIAHHSDKIVFPSTKVYSSFASSFPVSDEKCIVQPQGVFLDNPYKNDHNAAKMITCELLSLPENSKIVLGIGYMDLRKGVDLFVQTAKAVLKDFNNVYFMWVGNKEEQLALWLRHDVENLGFQEKVLFVDAAEDITHFYAAADVFVLPSREDPFPIVLLDAMDAGTPVVGFEKAGGFEDIIDGGNGVLVPYLDTESMARTIGNLLKNEQVAIEMGKKGQETIEEFFDFNKYVESLLSSF